MVITNSDEIPEITYQTRFPETMIAIYSNTSIWGGVDILVGRFADYLSSRGIEYCVIEPDEGRIRKEFPNARFVSPDQTQSIANRITHVFFPSLARICDPRFPWEILAHAKVLTWVIHPNVVFRSFFPYSTALMNIFGYRAVKVLRHLFPDHTKLFDAFFVRLIADDAMIVMDGATSRSLKYFVPTLNAEAGVVPIPSSLSEASAVRHQSDGVLSIGYLGRMDVMKWSAIRPFIRHTLAPIAKHRRVALHLVSDGTHLSRVERLCLDSGIQFHCYGYLPNLKAREVIFTNTDLAIAMGTSALDLAGAGHPCVMIDPGLGMFVRHQEHFRFVHEIQDYTLGEFRDFPGYVDGCRGFEELTDNSELDIARVRGMAYVHNAHDPVRCFDGLLNRIRSSNLRVAELEIQTRSLSASFWNAKDHPLLCLVKAAFKNTH